MALSLMWLPSALFSFQLVMTKKYEAGLFLVYLALLSSRLQHIQLMFSDSGNDGEGEDESQTEFRVQTLDSGMLELK